MDDAELLASLLEANGKVCHPIELVGHGLMCETHKFIWPCPRQWQITRQELVAALRQLGIERDEARAVLHDTETRDD